MNHKQQQHDCDQKSRGATELYKNITINHKQQQHNHDRQCLGASVLYNNSTTNHKQQQQHHHNRQHLGPTGLYNNNTTNHKQQQNDWNRLHRTTTEQHNKMDNHSIITPPQKTISTTCNNNHHTDTKPSQQTTAENAMSTKTPTHKLINKEHQTTTIKTPDQQPTQQQTPISSVQPPFNYFEDMQRYTHSTQLTIFTTAALPRVVEQDHDLLPQNKTIRPAPQYNNHQITPCMNCEGVLIPSGSQLNSPSKPDSRHDYNGMDTYTHSIVVDEQHAHTRGESDKDHKSPIIAA